MVTKAEKKGLRPRASGLRARAKAATKAKAKAAPAKKAKAAPAKAKAKAKPAKAKAKAKPAPAKKAKAAPAKKAKAAPAKGAPIIPETHAPPPIAGIPSPAAARGRLLVDGERFGDATLTLRPLPPLRLTSGVVVACDPFEVHGPALARRLRPGSYDVVAAVASYPGKHGPGEELLAAVIVKVSDGEPSSWEQATFADEDGAADPTYPCDSGVGCFMDAKLQAALAAQPTTHPTASYRALEHQLLDEHHVPTWSWASYQPEATAPATCVAFLGGAAPTRRSYWGLDHRGAITCLLTDLETFPADAWQ